MNPSNEDQTTSGNTARNLARVIHELQVPVVALRGSLDFASRELKDRGVTMSEDWLGEAWQWTELMVSLLQNAQIVAASEMGKQTIRVSRLNFLKDIVNPAMRAVSVLFRERGISQSAVAFRHLEILPPLYADKTMLHQLLFNLLSNALKYGGRDPRIEIAAEKEQGGWNIKFRDWGIGVPDAEAPNIFSGGYRGRNAVIQSASGIGMGLYVTREILRQHGGTIDLTQVQNPTEFTIFLPERLTHPPVTEHTK